MLILTTKKLVLLKKIGPKINKSELILGYTNLDKVIGYIYISLIMYNNVLLISI